MTRKPVYAVRVDPLAVNTLGDAISDVYRDFVSNMIGSTTAANLIGNTTPRAIPRKHRIAVSFVVYDNTYPPFISAKKRYLLKRD